MRRNIQKLVFRRFNRKLVDFPYELQRLAKDTFSKATHATIEQFKYTKVPTHMKKSMKKAN